MPGTQQPYWDHRARQAVLDALLPLTARRLAAAEALAAGRPMGATRLVARGAEIEPWMRAESLTWTDLRSIRVAAEESDLVVSLPQNRACLEHGLHMVSVFDHGGVSPGARSLLAAETEGLYLFAYAPLQLKVVDRRTVLLQGPFVGDEATVMASTDSAVLAAATTYWRAVMSTAMPARGSQGVHTGLTPRQHQVMTLLLQDHQDERVASVLGVSVRTVRSDVSRAMRTFGVTSRFAAGVAFARSTRASGTDGPA